MSVRRPPAGGPIAIQLVGVVAESAGSAREGRRVEQVWVADREAVEALMGGSLDALAQSGGASAAYRLLTALWDRLER